MPMTEVLPILADYMRSIDGAVRPTYSTEGSMKKDAGTTEGGLNVAVPESGKPDPPHFR